MGEIQSETTGSAGFEPVSSIHRPLFEEMIRREDSQNSCESFGNVYLWDLLCRRNVTRLGNRLGLEYMCPRGTFYAFPLGDGPLVPAVEALRERAAFRGVALRLWGMSRREAELLEQEYPGAFTVSEDRNNFDYIYRTEALATLSGKKLHGKRNHCNRFEKENEWSFSPLSPEHFDACREILAAWDRENEQEINPEEGQAIERVFREWDALGMLGGVLYAGGRPVAFTVGEQLREDTVDVHFEKAVRGLPGAYPMIAREFARYVQEALPGALFLNREEDMGEPGLRRAKEEWYPEYLLEKYTALWTAES